MLNLRFRKFPSVSVVIVSGLIILISLALVLGACGCEGLWTICYICPDVPIEIGQSTSLYAQIDGPETMIPLEFSWAVDDSSSGSVLIGPTGSSEPHDDEYATVYGKSAGTVIVALEQIAPSEELIIAFRVSEGTHRDRPCSGPCSIEIKRPLVEYSCPSQLGILESAVITVKVFNLNILHQAGKLDGSIWEVTDPGILALSRNEVEWKTSDEWEGAPESDPDYQTFIWDEITVKATEFGSVQVSVRLPDSITIGEGEHEIEIEVTLNQYRQGSGPCSIDIPPEAANLIVVEGSLVITPPEVELGEGPVTIEVTVQNTGMEEGTQTIPLIIDGEQQSSREVTLAGGESEVISWEVWDPVVGPHTAHVDGEEGHYVVWVQYELSISSSDGGSVTTPGEGSYPYHSFDVVDLSAQVAEGYQFDRWEGDVDNTNSANTTVTIDADKSVMAMFVPLPPMVLTSKAFIDGGTIPLQYAHTWVGGSNISPPLEWTGVPPGTKSFVLIMEDPAAGPCVHWIVFNIPADVTSLEEGASSNLPGDALQGTGSDAFGYYGCEPLDFYVTHYYNFTLYALDTMLDLNQGATKQQVLDAMEGHIRHRAELVGTYYMTH